MYNCGPVRFRVRVMGPPLLPLLCWWIGLQGMSLSKEFVVSLPWSLHPLISWYPQATVWESAEPLPTTPEISCPISPVSIRTGATIWSYWPWNWLLHSGMADITQITRVAEQMVLGLTTPPFTYRKVISQSSWTGVWSSFAFIHIWHAKPYPAGHCRSTYPPSALLRKMNFNQKACVLTVGKVSILRMIYS